MNVIWKYQIYGHECVLYLPTGARFLDAQVQDEVIYSWFLINRDMPEHPVRVRLIGTGEPLPEGLNVDFNYGATLQDGMFVWHVFVER